MTHIANCMKSGVTPGHSFYIAHDGPCDSPSDLEDEAEDQVHDLFPSPNPDLVGGAFRFQRRPSLASSRAESPQPSIVSNSSDKSMAPSVSRSGSSLCDSVIMREPVGVPSRHRAGSLSRRRKISVPELGTMATVQELSIDSRMLGLFGVQLVDSPDSRIATIPGMPPIRRAPSTDALGHERSSSAPNWRQNPFGDAMMSCVTGPAPILDNQLGSATTTWPPKNEKQPLRSAPPTQLPSRPVSPHSQPTNTSYPIRPQLKVTTAPLLITSREKAPEVPPKSPWATGGNDRESSNVRQGPRSARVALTPASATTAPTSASASATAPSSTITPKSAFEAVSPWRNRAATEGQASNKRSPSADGKSPSAHNRKASEPTTSDRGRSAHRTAHERDDSKSNTSDKQRNRSGSAKSPKEKVPWKLPIGMPAPEASRTMSLSEREGLYKQAASQVETFEVLTAKDVQSLSRELRAIDERCDYLRRTYKSLRTSRQTLHSRMISYLKRSETAIFSRESFLRQEEILAELDVSIDDWISKLEQAENRRLRIRQKLLEHVAAALTVQTRDPSPAHSTPPRSPVKPQSPTYPDRRDVESIRIYADGQVLDLFSDIEQAIGRMAGEPQRDNNRQRF